VLAAGPQTTEELLALLDDGAEKYPELTLAPTLDTFSGELVPLSAPTGDGIDSSESGYGDEWAATYSLYLAAGQSVSLSLVISGRSSAIPDARVIFEGPADEVLVDRHVAVPFEGEREELVEHVAASAGVYRLTYQNAFNEFHRLRYPRALSLVRELPTDFSYFVPERRHWFFVPLGTRRFALRTDCDQRTLFHGPAGDVAASWHGTVAVVDVAAGQDGQPWSMSAYCGSAQFLNIPNYVAYRADQLLVPKDAKP
jgi:hypothetical protein